MKNALGPDTASTGYDYVWERKKAANAVGDLASATDLVSNGTAALDTDAIPKPKDGKAASK